MNILVDKNIPFATVRTLRERGHNARDVRGTPEKGISDTDLWRIAQSERRVLVSTDKGFTEHRNCHNYGILVIRLRQPNRRKIHERTMQALTQFSQPEDWLDLLVVMRDAVQSIWHTPNQSAQVEGDS